MAVRSLLATSLVAPGTWCAPSPLPSTRVDEGCERVLAKCDDGPGAGEKTLDVDVESTLPRVPLKAKRESRCLVISIGEPNPSRVASGPARLKGVAVLLLVLFSMYKSFSEGADALPDG